MSLLIIMVLLGFFEYLVENLVIFSDLYFCFAVRRDQTKELYSTIGLPCECDIVFVIEVAAVYSYLPY